MDQRSGCPINLSIEVFGDRWTMVILRDMMFGNRRSYRDILTNSIEGIASNILASRLKMLLKEGMISKADDPSHKQKSIYSLTEKSIALVPIMAQLGAWGRRFLPVSEELAVRARLLDEGGPAMWDDFMDELRHIHLGQPLTGTGPSVLQRLRTAYEKAAERKGSDGPSVPDAGAR